MKDPARLLEASASDFEQQLLRAGASEQPSTAAMQRLAEGLGVSVSTPTASAPGLRLMAANKSTLVVAGIAGLGLALGTVAWLGTQDSAPPGPARGSAAALPAPQSAAENSALPHDRVATADSNAPDSHSLALEVARIDLVRGHLAARRSKPALALLQGYEREFPSGVLRQEAELLTIEAHGQAGDRRRARTLAARFLARNPDSPHNARVRDLLDAMGPDAR